VVDPHDPPRATAFVERVGSRPAVRLEQPLSDGRADFKVFLGPKAKEVLADANFELSRLLDFGWFWFIAIPMLYALRSLHTVTGNYGVDIILLTALVRVATIPLTQKSFKSMREMQKIQPQLKRIQEQYKDDQTKLQKEMMELYKSHGVNPFSGCAPMVLQIPIFVGLYNALLHAIELRHAPFALWITDLSSPERLMVAGVGIPVMTLVMGATMLVQQWLTPQQGDPTQRQMMTIMPVVFTFMSSTSVRLVLYWLAATCSASPAAPDAQNAEIAGDPMSQSRPKAARSTTRSLAARVSAHRARSSTSRTPELDPGRQLRRKARAYTGRSAIRSRAPGARRRRRGRFPETPAAELDVGRHRREPPLEPQDRPPQPGRSRPLGALGGGASGVDVAAPAAVPGDDGTWLFTIEGDGAGIVIGRHGQTLDAIEYLMSRIASHEAGNPVRISLDVEGYRERRQESLEQTARRAADKARGTGRPVALSPMSPRDRRVVHGALSEERGVTTRSQGEVGFRRVVGVPSRPAGRPAD
jgi:YidC/Oxa1 family membrane protein insertase